MAARPVAICVEDLAHEPSTSATNGFRPVEPVVVSQGRVGKMSPLVRVLMWRHSLCRETMGVKCSNSEHRRRLPGRQSISAEVVSEVGTPDSAPTQPNQSN